MILFLLLSYITYVAEHFLPYTILCLGKIIYLWGLYPHNSRIMTAHNNIQNTIIKQKKILYMPKHSIRQPKPTRKVLFSTFSGKQNDSPTTGDHSEGPAPLWKSNLLGFWLCLTSWKRETTSYFSCWASIMCTQQ